MNRRHHSPIQQKSGLVNAGRIYEDDLPLVCRNNSFDLVSGRLGLFLKGGDLFTDEAVEQCGLAGVRAADKRDEPASKVLWRHRLDVIRTHPKT